VLYRAGVDWWIEQFPSVVGSLIVAAITALVGWIFIALRKKVRSRATAVLRRVHGDVWELRNLTRKRLGEVTVSIVVATVNAEGNGYSETYQTVFRQDLDGRSTARRALPMKDGDWVEIQATDRVRKAGTLRLLRDVETYRLRMHPFVQG